MFIKDLAKRIPDEIRSQILLTEEDIIFNAIAVKDNINMSTLLRIWYEFVEPEKEPSDCPICIGNILTNYRQMKDVLVELENDYQRLKSL